MKVAQETQFQDPPPQWHQDDRGVYYINRGRGELSRPATLDEVRLIIESIEHPERFGRLVERDGRTYLEGNNHA